MINLNKTSRGFYVAEFKDRTQEMCSIQESSIATEACIWLGYSSGPRMHLTIDNVEELLPLLNRFVDTGSLNPISDSEYLLYRVQEISKQIEILTSEKLRVEKELEEFKNSI